MKVGLSEGLRSTRFGHIDLGCAVPHPLVDGAMLKGFPWFRSRSGMIRE